MLSLLFVCLWNACVIERERCGELTFYSISCSCQHLADKISPRYNILLRLLPHKGLFGNWRIGKAHPVKTPKQKRMRKEKIPDLNEIEGWMSCLPASCSSLLARPRRHEDDVVTERGRTITPRPSAEVYSGIKIGLEYQKEETVEHLLLTCVFSRKI